VETQFGRQHRIPRAVEELDVEVPLLVVAGTRPEAIKLLPLVAALRQHPRIAPVVVATGQHPTLVEDVLGLAGLTVDRNLRVGHPGVTLNELFAGVLRGLESYVHDRFGESTPDVNDRPIDAYPAACVVHGDTTSAAAAALAAFHLRIPVVHVEAGLRTRSTLSPFPEELNRQIIARIATFHLAPTELNAQNLVREGVDIRRIFVTGNTGIDALRWAAERRAPYGPDGLADLEHDEFTRVVTVTAHRRENWGDGLHGIATGVRRLAGRYPDVRFVLPVHPNPAVAASLHDVLDDSANVSLVPPMEYLGFARLLARSTLVITDSGGIQEEAPALGVPVLVTRTSTERGEGIEAGTLELVGTDPDRIETAAARLLDDPDRHAEVAARTNPYGDGHAVDRIVESFDNVLLDAPRPQPFGPGYSRAVVLDAAGYRRVPSLVVAHHPTPEAPATPDQSEPLIEDVIVR